MIPTQEQIHQYITKANQVKTNSIVDFTVAMFMDNPVKYLKRFLLEMKVQIDRWDLVMTNLYIHPDMEKILLTWLHDDISLPDYKDLFPDIWGCKIIKSLYVPEDMMIGYTSPGEMAMDMEIEDSRNIVIGRFDKKLMSKLDHMKAFW